MIHRKCQGILESYLKPRFQPPPNPGFCVKLATLTEVQSLPQQQEIAHSECLARFFSNTLVGCIISQHTVSVLVTRVQICHAVTIPNIPAKHVDTMLYINRPMNLADENMPRPGRYPVPALEYDGSGCLHCPAVYVLL